MCNALLTFTYGLKYFTYGTRKCGESSVGLDTSDYFDSPSITLLITIQSAFDEQTNNEQQEQKEQSGNSVRLPSLVELSVRFKLFIEQTLGENVSTHDVSRTRIDFEEPFLISIILTIPVHM